MSSTYSDVAPRQLHTLLPGPHGGQACLSLYDVCPHTASAYTKEPYLHCSLPPPRSDTSSYASAPCKEIHSTEITVSHPKEKPLAASLAPLVLSRHSPVMRHIRASTAPRSILKNPVSLDAQALPTIYLLSFSTDRTPTTRSFAELLGAHLPPRLPLAYTIDASGFRVPARALCDVYSGVAAPLQDAVVRDPRAWEEVRSAVHELVRFVERGTLGKEVLGRGVREIGLAVCCTAGTHRSVAIAELVAKGVREEVRRVGMGVKIVVRHVHRIRGVQDPY